MVGSAGAKINFSRGVSCCHVVGHFSQQQRDGKRLMVIATKPEHSMPAEEPVEATGSIWRLLAKAPAARMRNSVFGKASVAASRQI